MILKFRLKYIEFCLTLDRRLKGNCGIYLLETYFPVIRFIAMKGRLDKPEVEVMLRDHQTVQFKLYCKV